MSDWKNVQYKDGKLRTGEGGGGGASALSDLTDVDLTNLADGQIIKWDATNSKWVNANESGGGSSGHTYSTTEQLTGDIWVDGKAIYEKTYVVNRATTQTLDLSDLNIDQILFYKGTVIETQNNMPPLPYATSGSDYALAYYSKSNSKLNMPYAGNYNAGTWNIVIQYTKTTD